MADIDLTRTHAMAKGDAKRAVERVAQDLEEQYGIPYRWEDDTLQFEGRGTDGQIAVTDSQVHVTIDMNFMVRSTMGSTIERRAKELLDEHLDGQ